MSYNNNFQVDYACPGFCSKCHTEVANFRGSQEVTRGVYRPKIESLKANFRQQTVDLSNGSQMMVPLCEVCYNLKPDDLPVLMTSEINGWKREIQDFGLGEDVKKWVKKAEKFSIIDVPSMKFDDNTRATLLMASVSKDVDTDGFDMKPISGGALVSKPFTFSAGSVIIASQHNSNFDTLFNLVNGALDGTNLAANAAIADTQLGQITTAGKVAGSAITLASTTIVTAVGSDYVLIGDTSDSGNPKKALASDLTSTFTPSVTNALSKSVIQVVYTTFSALASGSGQIPMDDSIPQISEGNEFMTQAITPNNASNILEIEIIAVHSNSATNNKLTGALFQGATASALFAVGIVSGTSTTQVMPIVLRYMMAAGTTSATTFRYRAGTEEASTTYFNGRGDTTARVYGGVAGSIMKITEYKA